MLTLKLNSLVQNGLTVLSGVKTVGARLISYQGKRQSRPVPFSTRHGNCRGPLATNVWQRMLGGEPVGDCTAIRAGRSAVSWVNAFHHLSSISPRFIRQESLGGRCTAAATLQNLARVLVPATASNSDLAMPARFLAASQPCRIPPAMAKSGSY